MSDDEGEDYYGGGGGGGEDYGGGGVGGENGTMLYEDEEEALRAQTAVMPLKTPHVRVCMVRDEEQPFTNDGRVLCLHDCHPWKGVAYHVPQEYDEKRAVWRVFGRLCSLPCVKAYRLYMPQKDWALVALVHEYAVQVHGWPRNVPIPCAPPRESLSVFQLDPKKGHTVQQFRALTKRHKHFISPVCGQQLEVGPTAMFIEVDTREKRRFEAEQRLITGAEQHHRQVAELRQQQQQPPPPKPKLPAEKQLTSSASGLDDENEDGEDLVDDEELETYEQPPQPQTQLRLYRTKPLPTARNTLDRFCQAKTRAPG